jgi:hypothetical protein
MLANLAWLGFVTFSGLRMFSYIPQIWRRPFEFLAGC